MVESFDGCDAGYEILDSGSLKLWRPEITDSGIYICVAENNAGRALGQVRLVVQGERDLHITVCMCVCERERETETETQRVCVCARVHVCVCVSNGFLKLDLRRMLALTLMLNEPRACQYSTGTYFPHSSPDDRGAADGVHEGAGRRGGAAVPRGRDAAAARHVGEGRHAHLPRGLQLPQAALRLARNPHRQVTLAVKCDQFSSSTVA